MQLPKLPEKKGDDAKMTELLRLMQDGDKGLIAVLLLLLMRENADKKLILALIYILLV